MCPGMLTKVDKDQDGYGWTGTSKPTRMDLSKGIISAFGHYTNIFGEQMVAIARCSPPRKKKSAEKKKKFKGGKSGGKFNPKDPSAGPRTVVRNTTNVGDSPCKLEFHLIADQVDEDEGGPEPAPACTGEDGEDEWWPNCGLQEGRPTITLKFPRPDDGDEDDPCASGGDEGEEDADSEAAPPSPPCAKDMKPQAPPAPSPPPCKGSKKDCDQKKKEQREEDDKKKVEESKKKKEYDDDKKAKTAAKKKTKKTEKDSKKPAKKKSAADKAKDSQAKFEEKGAQTRVETGTAVGAMRIPTGISNLVWSSTVDMWPETHFVAAFTGATPENREESMDAKQDPEDRIFVFREPFFTTEFRKSEDKIEFAYRNPTKLYLGEIYVVGPDKTILGDTEEMDEDGEEVEEKDEKEQDKDKKKKKKSGRRLHGGSKPRLWRGSSRGSELEELEKRDRSLSRLLDLAGDHLMDGQMVPYGGDDDRGRRLKHMSSDGQDVCLSGTVGLYDETFPLFEKEFAIMIFPGLEVGGAIILELNLNFAIRGELCLGARALTITLIPLASLILSVQLFAIIAKVLKGGIEVSASLLAVALEPSIAFILKNGFQVGGQLAFVIYPTLICINAFVDIMWIEFCDVGFISLPCGLDWKRLLEIELYCLTIPKSGDETKWIIFSKDSEDDTTPPVVGTVEATQETTSSAAVRPTPCALISRRRTPNHP